MNNLAEQLKKANQIIIDNFEQIGRMSEALEIGIKWMEWWINQEFCDCDEYGHICGKPERKKELEQMKKALSESCPWMEYQKLKKAFDILKVLDEGCPYDDCPDSNSNCHQCILKYALSEAERQIREEMNNNESQAHK